MKEKTVLLAVIAVSFLFTSCTLYESPVPAGSPDDAKQDNRLIGTWKGNIPDQDSNTADLMAVIPFNDNEYLIKAYSLNLTDSTIKDLMLLRAFSSRIGNQNIYSVLNIDPADSIPQWVFFKANFVSSDSLELQSLGKEFTDKKFQSSKRFRRYLKANKDLLNENFDVYATFNKVTL